MGQSLAYEFDMEPWMWEETIPIEDIFAGEGLAALHDMGANIRLSFGTLEMACGGTIHRVNAKIVMPRAAVIRMGTQIAYLGLTARVIGPH